MVYFPERRADGSWAAEPIFTKRIPHTVDFQIDGIDGSPRAEELALPKSVKSGNFGFAKVVIRWLSVERAVRDPPFLRMQG